MIRDFIYLVIIAFGFMLFGLTLSFVSFKIWNGMIPEFERQLNQTVNMTESDYNQWKQLKTTLSSIPIFVQFLSVLSVVMLIIATMILVFSVRFTPLAIPLAILVYLIGIWLCMSFSNVYVQVRNKFLELDSSFQINPYFDYFYINLPYIYTGVGFTLMVLAFTKGFGKKEEDKRFEIGGGE